MHTKTELNEQETQDKNFKFNVQRNLQDSYYIM